MYKLLAPIMDRMQEVADKMFGTCYTDNHRDQLGAATVRKKSW